MFIALCVMVCLPAEASTLYSNFNLSMGFEMGFDSNNGWVVDGADLTDQVLTESFTTLEEASLAQIQLAMGFYTGSVNPVLYLESEAACQPSSGLPLDTLSAPPGNIGPFPGVQRSRSCLQFMPDRHTGRHLLAGGAGAGRNERHVWNLHTINDANNNGIVFNDFGSRNGPWTPGLSTDLRAVMEVDGIPVSSIPEPGYAASTFKLSQEANRNTPLQALNTKGGTSCSTYALSLPR